MKLGDFVKVPDGRIGTVVFNGLVGIGIIFGKIELTKEDREIILGINPLFGKAPRNYKFFPEAMLRDRKLTNIIGLECVGDEKFCEVQKK